MRSPISDVSVAGAAVAETLRTGHESGSRLKLRDAELGLEIVATLRVVLLQ